MKELVRSRFREAIYLQILATSFSILEGFTKLWMEQVILEGVYALHPNIRPFLNLWVAVVMTTFFLMESGYNFFRNII